MPGGESEVIDFRNLKFEYRALRTAIIAFTLVVALIIAWDIRIWCLYGLPTLNASLMAQGEFALPVVAGIAALGAGYGFFRTTYKGVSLFGKLPDDVRKALEELGIHSAPVAPSGRFTATVSASAGEAVSEDTTAPSSGESPPPPESTTGRT